MQPDSIVTIGQSLVQHGPANDRIYLMKINGQDSPSILYQMDALARKQGYSKLFAKVPELYVNDLLSCGYRMEAHVPCAAQPASDELAAKGIMFMGKYMADWRLQPDNDTELEKVLSVSQDKATDGLTLKDWQLPGKYEAGILSPAQAREMAVIYKQVFTTYPFPIHDPRFIAQTMEEGTVYCGIRRAGRLVALASAELDESTSSAEMTDFATLPLERGNGLAGFLLAMLESEVANRGIDTAFTIARAVSYGMNITFSRAGYQFGGMLPNNTNIAGALESMNVWHKSL